MSGNQETGVRPCSWLCSDFNAGIPIKKRKFFVQPLSPPAEEPSMTLSENFFKPNKQGGSGNAMSVSCSSDVTEDINTTLPVEKGGSSATAVVADQKIVDRLSLNTEERCGLFQSDFMGNVGKIDKPGDVKAGHTVFSSTKREVIPADFENIVCGPVDQHKVKAEEVDLPVSSVSFIDAEKKEQLVKPSGSNVGSSSVQSFSLAKLASEEELVKAESAGVGFSSDKTGMNIDRTVLTRHDMIEETCDNKNFSGGYQAELFPGSDAAKLSLGCKAADNIHYREKEEPLALNFLLTKVICPPHNPDNISVSANAGGCNGINRSNWDLNTNMESWEDARDCVGIGEANLAFLGNKSSPLHDKASSANSMQENRSLRFRSNDASSMQSDHQDNSRCSLSLGLSSYPYIQRSPLLASTTQTGSAYTKFSWPMMTAGEVNPVILRIVKSEFNDEVVTQDTENAKICPVELSSNRVKQEQADKCSQETISSSGFLRSVDPTSVKAEPNNCTLPEAANRKAGTSNQPDVSSTLPNETRDSPTCSTSDQKERQTPYSIGYSKVHVSFTGVTVNPGDSKYSECAMPENSAQSSSETHGVIHKTLKYAPTDMKFTCFGQGDNNRNVSDVSVASLTEDKKEPPLHSCGTVESSLSDDEKINLSGDMLEEDLYGSDFESDGAHDLSKVKKKQDGSINEDAKVQRSAAAVVSEDNSPSRKSKLEHASTSGSDVINRDMAAASRGDFQNPSHADERGSESAIVGKTGNEHNKECSGTSLNTKLKKYADDDSCLMELVEMRNSESEIKSLIPEIQRQAFDGSGGKEGEIIQDVEHSSCRIIHASEGVSGASTVSSVNVPNPEVIDKSSTAFYGADVSTVDPYKGFGGGGSHSRTINMARVSDKSPAKTLDASGSFGLSRVERGRFSGIPLESMKFLSRGSCLRNEAFNDESCKFLRARYHGQFGNEGLNFIPDRRRFSDRTESNPRDRDSENYCNSREDGAFVRSFHRERRCWNDQTKFFPNSFSRRRSSGYSFTHRGPINSEDAAAFNGLRDGEKITRGLPRNNIDPMAMPQSPYEDLDGRFVRGQRNFCNNHKRAFPRFCSRSPNRSRTRSPGHCSSFRNRSPDEFAGHSDLPCQRSSPSSRMERIRSPDHSGFPRDMAVRRHGSPPYSSRPSNVLRDVGSGRGRSHRSSGISFRNRPGHVFRNHGKINILDSRERVEYGNDMFEGPSHADRFGIHVNVERRRFGDRHDGIRFSRPSFNTDDCTPANIENGLDGMRFGREDDTETKDGGNSRECDRQNNNITENTSVRARNVEEKEESCRHGGEVWQDGEFDDEHVMKNVYQ